MGNRKNSLHKTPNPRPTKAKPLKQGVFRIIGGQWRGRKMHFAEVDGLRPSLDRVRETLFNWLQGDIQGARCLDLFTGAGSLALEALSRGAAHVEMVELNPIAHKQLQHNVELLGSDKAHVRRGDALELVEQAREPVDIMLIDPPFRQGFAQQICDKLAKVDWLHAGALIYLETERKLDLEWPEHWELLKDKTAGQLNYRLFEVLEK